METRPRRFLALQSYLGMTLALVACSGGSPGSGDSGGGPGGGVTSRGVVALTSSDTTSFAIANFWRDWYVSSPNAGTAPGCTSAKEGDCHLVDCAGDSGKAEGVSLAKGGTVTVTVGTQTLTLTPVDIGGGAAEIMAPFWTSAGVELGVAGTAADVPAFMLETPSPGTITALAFPVYSPSTMIISEDSDLDVTWTGGAAGNTVSLVLGSSGDDASFIRVSCDFPAASGHGVVPASLLAMIPTGTFGSLDVQVSSTATTIVGVWQLELTAFQQDGPASIDVEFQ